MRLQGFPLKTVFFLNNFFVVSDPRIERHDLVIKASTHHDDLAYNYLMQFLVFFVPGLILKKKKNINFFVNCCNVCSISSFSEIRLVSIQFWKTILFTV